jgi:hypothetical protein
MKKMPFLIFPVLFALLTMAFFLFLYHDTLNSPGMTSAWLVFLTALGWSVLIVPGQNRARRLKAICAAAVLLVSVSLIEIFRPFPVDPLQHRLMVAVQALGMAGIIFYLTILKRKGESPHD